MRESISSTIHREAIVPQGNTEGAVSAKLYIYNCSDNIAAHYFQNHSTKVGKMASPSDYTMFNKVQKCKVLSIIEEFNEDLKNICGKCMDIGCGPGDITNDILLPSLGSDAQLIGKKIINSRNVITML